MKNKTWKSLKYGFGLAITAAAIYNIFKYDPALQGLTSKDFDNAEWVEVHNHDGRIYDNYIATNMVHNQNNWEGYQQETNKRNPNGLTGKILVPEFDNIK